MMTTGFAKFLETLRHSFIGDPDEGDSRSGKRKRPDLATEGDIRRLYDRPPSFTNLLPWLEYGPAKKVFLLDDGISVAALFELIPIPAESRTEQYLEEIRDKLQIAIADAIPEEGNSPWILQFFLQDELHLASLADRIREYASPSAKNSRLTNIWLEILENHLRDIARPGGLFVDQGVSGGPWQGRIRKVRAVVYRKQEAHAGPALSGAIDPEAELEDVANRFQLALETAGVGVRRCEGKDLYDWMFRWFNPDPEKDYGANTEEVLKQAPYPGDEDAPFGRDFSELLVLGMPRSDYETGTWWFDNRPHRAVVVQTLRRIPDIGLFGAERARGDRVFALFDRMPEHTVMAMTITIQAQDRIKNHLARIQRASVGDYAEAQLAGEDAQKAMLEVAKGNKLFPVQTTFFARGDDPRDLRKKINDLNSLLLSNGVQAIREGSDLLPLDTYIRSLPMRYEHTFDRRNIHRSRLTFARHIANLAPLYGRFTGTGNPGLLFFNRGAEPLTFDPLNRADRKKNGHGLILGPTGAGKSATLVYFILQMLAIHRPRVFVIEAGNSFGLLGQYLAANGVKVNPVSLQPNADVSLPPFSEALKLVDNRRLDLQLGSAKDTDDDPSNDYDEDEPDENTRDLLGEMEIAARIMITGGDPREDNRMTRADRLLIRLAILQAAKAVKAGGRDQVLTEDVVAGLRGLGEFGEKRADRAKEMADGMELFCSGLAGHFFNRPGKRWPSADLTLVDMGILARDGYEDQLTVAYIGLMNHIHDLVERHQSDDRPTLVVTDEGHIITTNPLLAPYVIKIVKMWRKFGAWFWIATQNLEDFPDASRKMLAMLEWWLCLVMPKDEVEQIARFKSLTDEERAMLLSAKKAPGLYAEGVVLSDGFNALFRNVPPPLALALAMTEKDEKAKRQQLMKENGCSELEAVRLMAEQIAKQRENRL